MVGVHGGEQVSQRGDIVMAREDGYKTLLQRTVWSKSVTEYETTRGVVEGEGGSPCQQRQLLERC